MQNTPNYNYNLPEYSDSADIAVLNANFSSIDANEYRIEGKLNALGNDIALPYDNTATYNVGDYVIYNNATYRCITAIATAEDFDSTKWTAITIGGELKSHDTRISTLEAGVDLEKSATNSFDDGIDSYFKKVVSTIVPVQAGSGTPSPTNVRAISGFTECTVKDASKNLLNNIATSKSITGVEFTVNSDKSVNVNTPSSSTATTQLILGEITLKANTSYILSGCPSGGSGSSYTLYIQAASGFSQIVDYGNGATFTPSVDVTTEVRIIIYNGAVVSNKVFYPMIRLATGADGTYAPYVAPTTATISFGSAGTVYGGTVDLISGKLVVDRGYLNPTEVTLVNTYDGYYRWVFAVSNAVDGVEGLLSSHFATTGSRLGSTYVISGGQYIVAYPTDQTLNTKALADAWLQSNNLQFVYKLATPQEYQLTPAQLRSLVGANRLTSSTGEVTEVEYIKNKTIAWLLDLIRA